MTIVRLLVLGVLTLSAVPALAADSLVIDRAHSETGFKIRHLFTNVSGRFGTFEGTIALDSARPEASTVSFTIDAASINTDNADRDKHLRSADFFDVGKFPTITFRSEKIRTTGKDRYDVTGTLTMHGVARTVTLPVSLLGIGKDPWGNERAGFTTSVILSRKDFGIVWNKALDSGGFVLGDDVAVTVDLQAVKQAPKSAVKVAS